MDHILCITCGVLIPSPRTTQKYCQPKCRERDWLEKNREYQNRKTREYRARRYKQDGRWLDKSPKTARMMRWMLDLKSFPCMDCGGTFDACCMDFDHRLGEVKEYNVGAMFAHHYSLQLIMKEVAKCDLVCSNCHRIRTRDRRTGSGKHRVQGVAEDPTLSP